MNPDFLMSVKGIFVGTDPVVSKPVDYLTVTLEGVVKDRHFGYSKLAGVREKAFHEKGTLIFNARQWSAVDQAELAAVAREMNVPEVKAEWLGANLLLATPSLAETRGFCFTKLPLLTRLVFEGGVVLLVYGENLPCKYPAEAMLAAEPEIFAGKDKYFAKAAIGKRGLVGWIERAGIIAPNETVKIHLPK